MRELFLEPHHATRTEEHYKVFIEIPRDFWHILSCEFMGLIENFPGVTKAKLDGK